MNNQERKQFLNAVLLVNTLNPFSISFVEEKIISNNQTIQLCIDRFLSSKSAIFPYIKDEGENISWILVSNDKMNLYRHAEEIKKFITPYLAEICEQGFKEFTSSENQELKKIGPLLFPFGYFCFRSSSDLMTDILDKIKLWISLDILRPDTSLDEIAPNSYMLRLKFHQSLALCNWYECNETLIEIRKKHYLSDENCAFLKIQLLSAQDRWEDIWNDENFANVSGLDPLPLKIRYNLLKSFYKCIIHPLEVRKDYTEIVNDISHYKEERNIGTLLRFRLGLKDDIFSRIFAYDALLNNNYDRLEELSREAENEETVKIIDELIDMIGGKNKATQIVDSMESAKRLFQESLYDEAFKEVQRCIFSIDKVKLMLGIATMTESDDVINLAKDLFNKLDEKAQRNILENPQTKGWAKYVLGFVGIEENNCTPIYLPTSWKELFGAIRDQVHLKEITEYCTSGEFFKRIDNQDILNDEAFSLIIWEIATYPNLAKEQITLLKLVVPYFTSYLLEDIKFPREHLIELYQNVAFLFQSHTNTNLKNLELFLRLLEGILNIDIKARDMLWDIAVKKFPEIPVVMFSANIIALIELFLDYGLAPLKIQSVWEQWVSSLINHFNQAEEYQVELWLEIGKIANTNDALIKLLQKSIHDKQVKLANPLQQVGHLKITIYSFREKAVKRAIDYIQKMNPKIVLNFCSDNVLTDRASQLAKSSDVVVLVTQCTSHALTQGVIPLLSNKSPLYPRSSGEQGLINIIEEYATKLIKNKVA